MRPGRRADNCVVLVVSYVKVRVEAQHSIPPVNLHECLREIFTFVLYAAVSKKQIFSLLQTVVPLLC